MKLLKLVPDNTNIDFMRWRNLALILSIIATVASLALVSVKGLNLGVDFVGGQMIRVTFAKQVDVEQLRSDVGSLNIGEGSIQETGGPRSYQIRMPKPEGGEAAANRAASQVRSMLEQRYPGSRVDSVETVSGKVSEELAWDGQRAMETTAQIAARRRTRRRPRINPVVPPGCRRSDNRRRARSRCNRPRRRASLAAASRACRRCAW